MQRDGAVEALGKVELMAHDAELRGRRTGSNGGDEMHGMLLLPTIVPENVSASSDQCRSHSAWGWTFQFMRMRSLHYLLLHAGHVVPPLALVQACLSDRSTGIRF